jgi:hypothetical protein
LCIIIIMNYYHYYIIIKHFLAHKLSAQKQKYSVAPQIF